MDATETILTWGQQLFAVLKWVIPPTLFAIATYFFTSKHFRKQKYYDFQQRRLVEFYGPMLGLIKQIRANAKARLEASRASDKA